MDTGDAINNIHHIPHFMGGKFEARDGKGLPKIIAEQSWDHNPALSSADPVLFALYFYLFRPTCLVLSGD